MNEQEKQDYLKQHFRLYEAEELAIAYQRVLRRMEPHYAELAMDDMSEWFSQILSESRIPPS